MNDIVNRRDEVPVLEELRGDRISGPRNAIFTASILSDFLGHQVDRVGFHPIRKPLSTTLIFMYDIEEFCQLSVARAFQKCINSISVTRHTLVRSGRRA